MDNPFEVFTQTAFFSRGFPSSTQWNPTNAKAIKLPLKDGAAYGFLSKVKIDGFNAAILCFPEEGFASVCRVPFGSVFEDNHICVLAVCHICRAMAEQGIKIDLDYLEHLKGGKL